jgi:ankyrin repeat protein
MSFVVNEYDEAGLTLIHRAAYANAEFLQLLSKMGADINLKSQTKSENTLLHYLIKNKELAKIEVLLEDPDCRLDIANKFGETAEDLIHASRDESLRNLLHNRKARYFK